MIDNATWRSGNLPTCLDALTSVSCTSRRRTETCEATGANITGNSESFTYDAFIIETIGTGGTWTRATLPTLPPESILLSTRCTGSGENTRCSAAGESAASVNARGASDWALIALSSSLTGAASSTSCTGAGANATCIISGGTPLLNGMTSRTAKSHAHSTHLNRLLKKYSRLHYSTVKNQPLTSNDPLKTSGLDASLGSDNATAPFIVQSTDGGSHWSLASITNNPSLGSLNGTGATSTSTPS